MSLPASMAGRLPLMMIVKLLATVSLLAATASVVSAASDPYALKDNYYASICPNAEKIIAQTVTAAYQNDTSIIAGLIRLAFHDCFVEGCDGSVLLDGNDTEKLGAPNANSLRGFEVIDAAKAALEAACPQTVSCADIVSFAARDSIYLGGGLNVTTWHGGRKDGNVSVSSSTLTELPAPFLNYDQLVQAFAKKGLSQAEMVTLSGGHTVGRAHCGIILSRIYNYQGTGQADPSINATFLATLKQLCPPTSPGNVINMEMLTPYQIDSTYFNNVLVGKVLFESDDALQETTKGKARVKLETSNVIFQSDFANAMVKMSKIEVKTGNQGNIRLKCNDTAGPTFPPPKTGSR